MVKKVCNLLPAESAAEKSSNRYTVTKIVAGYCEM